MSIEIDVGTIDDILAVSAGIPEFDRTANREKLESRLTDVQTLILIARVGGLAVGYKVGYALSKDVFYSWLGGVMPEYRGRGIATLLLHYQERWVADSAYTSISVKSMNCYPQMLKLLISNEYKIVGCEVAENDVDGKILFSKELGSSGNKPICANS